MIYLDNAATSFPKPESVYRALDLFARTALANPGRGGHRMAREAEHNLADARHRLNRLFHGEGPERWAFTLNCTDALNMAFHGLLEPGDHVITSAVEHNSIARPLTALANAGTIELTRVPVDGEGRIDPHALAQAITPQTKLVAITHASNVLGTVQPLAEIGCTCRERGVAFLVDAAQSAGMVTIDVQAMHVDLLAFPGHKGLFGPTGTGALYVSPRLRLKPMRQGGTGGDSASPIQPEEMPHRLEAGTPNLLGIAGLAAGLDFVERETPAGLLAHEIKLCERLRQRLLMMQGFELFGPAEPEDRVGLLSFRHAGILAQDLAAILDAEFDIALRAGLHCAPFAHRSVGSFPDGLLRVSPGPFNTEADIDRLADALEEISSGV